MRASFRELFLFLRGLRAAAVRGYRRRYGLAAALPVVWAALDTHLWPGWSCLGFLALAWFLEGRPGPRLAGLAAAFAACAFFFTARLPPAPAALPPGSFPIEGQVLGFPVRKNGIQFDFATGIGGFRVRANLPGLEPMPGLPSS